MSIDKISATTGQIQGLVTGSQGVSTLNDSPALKRLQGGGSGSTPEPAPNTIEIPKMLHCPPGQDGSPPFGSPGFLY